MQKDVRELNGLIETISQKMIDKTINDRYLMSRMAVIVNEFDPITNSASIIIPTDLQNPTTYKYPNRTGKNKLNSTVWEDGAIKTYGDKVYLIYQTNNISQGWLESNEALVLDAGTIDYNELENRPQINGVTLEGNLTTSDIGITIPTKTSDLTNDSGFLDANDFKTVNNQSIVGSGNIQIDGGTKFIKGTPITLYDTDGTTPLHNLLPENILFYDGNQGSSDLFNYNSLDNKPSINGVTLIGNKTTDDLGIVSKFIKGTPINLYDTDGTTVLYSRNPENLVFYDGESGENVASNFVYASASTNVSISAASTQYYPSWSVKSSKGTGFEIASNGDILCNKNGKVLVLACAYMTSSSTGSVGSLRITKNRVQVGTSIGQVVYNHTSLNSQAVVNVTAGDTLSYQVANNTANAATLQTGSSIVCIFIEDYYITQNVDISQNTIYSTTESVIGQWIDNKPIYRKVITGTSSSQSWTVALDVSNVDVFLNVDVRVLRSGTYTQNSNVGSYYYTSSDYFNWYMSTPNSKTLTCRCGSDWPKRPIDYAVIIEYTKTTD